MQTAMPALSQSACRDPMKIPFHLEDLYRSLQNGKPGSLPTLALGKVKQTWPLFVSKAKSGLDDS